MTSRTGCDNFVPSNGVTPAPYLSQYTMKKSTASLFLLLTLSYNVCHSIDRREKQNMRKAYLIVLAGMLIATSLAGTSRDIELKEQQALDQTAQCVAESDYTDIEICECEYKHLPDYLHSALCSDLD